ncbi:unnamed protein product [Caretta caretta]
MTQPPPTRPMPVGGAAAEWPPVRSRPPQEETGSGCLRGDLQAVNPKKKIQTVRKSESSTQYKGIAACLKCYMGPKDYLPVR